MIHIAAKLYYAHYYFITNIQKVINIIHFAQLSALPWSPLRSIRTVTERLV